MKRLLIVAAALSALILSVTACNSGPKTTLCVNPLTYTDIPDNDVIRVGDTFYMVSTTMFFCPGAPIMASKDLVHWQIVNYVYDCLADDDIYNLRGDARSRYAYGRGQWATSLRYYDNKYYAFFCANDQRKTYIFSTDDIENGKWDKTVIDGIYHDASLLREDDGRVYLAYSNGDIRIIELESDLSGIKEGGVDQLLLSSPREGYILRAEGSHFYHIGDWYYILEIDWPRDGVRTETCWRSKTLLGEYEPKVVLQGAFDGRGDGVAQGAIVDTPKGDWYAIMFQDHGAVGRIPTLQPVTWVDGWPIMGDNGVPVKEFEVKLKPSGENYVWASDEFDSKELALVWQWNHKPLDGCWSLTDRPGWLRLTTGQTAENLAGARNTLTQRTVGPKCESEIKMDVSGLKGGEFAGLAAFQSQRMELGVKAAEDGSLSVALVKVGRGGSETVYEAPLAQKDIWFKIDYNFDEDTATASYSLDGEAWNDIDFTLKMSYTLDYFIGYRSAIFNYTAGELGGYVDVDYFHQKNI